MSKIKNKWVEDASGSTVTGIDGVKLRLQNLQSLRARNAANTADINVLEVDGSNIVQLQTQTQIATTPTSPNDLVNKAYADALRNGFNPKAPFACATTAALATNTYANGSSGVGATLTASANGALAAIDGYTAVVNDRILVKNEATAANNGIYVLTQVGDASHPYILTRATDADTQAKLTGAYSFVLSGTVNGDHEFLLQAAADATITIGTTALTWLDFGSNSVSAGSGIAVSAGTVSARLGNGLSFDGSTNIQVATQAAGSTQTTGIDGSGNIKASSSNVETFTLTSTDITNSYVDLAQVAQSNSVEVIPAGGSTQRSGTDYTLNYTGGTGSKTRVTFAGDLSTLLVSGDVIQIFYRYV